jgi:hypothetical protein
MKSRKGERKTGRKDRKRCGYRKSRSTYRKGRSTQRGGGFGEWFKSIFVEEKKEEVPVTPSEPSTVITRKNIPSFGSASAPASAPASTPVSTPVPQTASSSIIGGNRPAKRSHKKRQTKRKH